MRSALWVSLVTVGVLTTALLVDSDAASPKTAELRSPASANGEKDLPWYATVEGSWSKTHEEAVQNAVENARAQVIAWLRSRRPPVVWEPTVDYVQQHLVTDLPEWESRFKEQKGSPSDIWIKVSLASNLARDQRAWPHGSRALEQKHEFEEPVGTMYQVRLRVTITPEDYKEIRRLDAEHRAEQRGAVSQQRMWLLAKILAGIVAVLTTVAVYSRLHEVTKGCYTWLLRLAAIGFLGSVGAVLLNIG